MKEHGALAHVAKWTECQPVNRKVTDSFPSQSTNLGCGPDPQLGVCERQLINGSLAHLAQCISSSLPPSIPLSLKINKILKKKEWVWLCPIKLYLRIQVAGRIWPTSCSLLTTAPSLPAHNWITRHRLTALPEKCSPSRISVYKQLCDWYSLWIACFHYIVHLLNFFRWPTNRGWHNPGARNTG